MAEETTDKKADPKKELFIRARKRAKIMMEADRPNRKLGTADMKFLRVPGEQWDLLTKQERGADRMMLEFNKLNVSVKSIINKMRENRPMGKVRAAEDGDVKTADIYEGVIRSIVANADFDTVTDYSAEYQVGAGMGAWQITVKYAEDSFNQVIDIDPLLNPFCLFCDPACKDILKRDAADWFKTDKISKDQYHERWPKAEESDFDLDTEFDDADDWDDEEGVRIGEYWYKEPYDKTLLLLSDGSTINELDEDGNKVTPPPGVTVLKSRIQRCHKIKMCILSGSIILEGPVDWAGPDHPFVMVYGEYVVIEGKVYWNGIARSGKDAQKAYNIERTSMVETVALAPQDKPWMTPKQVAGLEAHLAEAHKKNFPYNLYNPDAGAPGPPVRMGGPAIPAALMQLAQMSSDDIKSVTGVYDASLGAQGNETSGKAINARKSQGEIANFNYPDNMGKGVKRTWEILVNLIPKVIDTEQTVRMLGADGKESYETVNKRDPVTNKIINDLSKGRFDTAITVGPSHATRRAEAAEFYTQMAGQDEGLMMSAGDLVYKAMDMPYAQEIAERRQALLPPPIQELLTKDKSLPPEVTAAMNQVKQAQAQVQQHGQLVQAAQQELQTEMAAAKSEKAGAQLAGANLKTQEAQFQAKQNELKAAEAALANREQLLAIATENALLKIENARIKAEHQLTETAHHHEAQATEASHSLENQHRDVQDAVKDGSHQLESQQRDIGDAVKDGSQQLKEQATSNQVANLQAQHKQQLTQAKQPPKPAK